MRYRIKTKPLSLAIIALAYWCTAVEANICDPTMCLIQLTSCQKVEQLTLYIIEQNKQLQQQQVLL